MRKYNLLGLFGVFLAMILVAGCLGGDDGDDEGTDEPTFMKYINASPNGQSTSEIHLEDYADTTHMKLVIKLDKTESVEEHMFYLYLFEGEEPDTMMVDFEDINDTLANASIEQFTMTWTDSEVTWEMDVDPAVQEQYTISMWHPKIDSYTEDTPGAYVDVEVYLS